MIIRMITSWTAYSLKGITRCSEILNTIFKPNNKNKNDYNYKQNCFQQASNKKLIGLK